MNAALRRWSKVIQERPAHYAVEPVCGHENRLERAVDLAVGIGLSANIDSREQCRAAVLEVIPDGDALDRL